MELSERVYNYCERGSDGALWAEPFNAVTNAGFLLAALIALLVLLRRPKDAQSADHFLLIALVFLIGLGSAAFHVFADRLTGLGDVVPIGVFMLVYLGFALNRFLRVPPGWTVLVVIGFTALAAVTMQLRCWNGGVGFPGEGVTNAGLCLNGSIGYLPALLAIVVVGVLLRERRHSAALYLLWAAAIFAVSIALRSLDFVLCDQVVIDGRKVGTHFIWHMLNALTLFLLLLASLKVRREDVPEAEPVTLTAASPVEPMSSPVDEAPLEPSSLDREAEVRPAGEVPKAKPDASRAAREAKKEAAAKAVSAGELALQEGAGRWLPAEAMPKSLAAVDTPPEAASEPPLEGEILPPRSEPDAGSPSGREDDAVEDAIEDDEPKTPGSDR
jgi:hypothetical protein